MAARTNKLTRAEEAELSRLFTINPADCTFLSVRRFSIAEICKGFGLSPRLIAKLVRASEQRKSSLVRRPQAGRAAKRSRGPK